MGRGVASTTTFGGLTMRWPGRGSKRSAEAYCFASCVIRARGNGSSELCTLGVLSRPFRARPDELRFGLPPASLRGRLLETLSRLD